MSHFTRRKLVNTTAVFSIISFMAFAGVRYVSITENQIIDNSSLTTLNSPSKPKVSTQVPSTDDVNITLYLESLARDLIQHHKHNIHETWIQANLLDLKKMLLEKFGDQGHDYFRQLIELAFPNVSVEIISLIAALENYERWHQDALIQLNQLPTSERYDQIQTKQYELLGERADAIWGEGAGTMQLQRAHLQQTIQQLNNNDIYSLEETLFQLSSALEAQGGSSDLSQMTNQATLSNLYFGLDSVQSKLASMSIDERQQAINDQRRAMGYTEHDIEQLEASDLESEQRWQNGYAYMAAKQEASNQLHGDDLTEKLAQLRQAYFASDAPTIAAEEDSGFYRYERPRYYGRN